MILTHEWIRLFRKARLIVIEPFHPEQLNANSYDVRLWGWYVRQTYALGRPSFSRPVWCEPGERIFAYPDLNTLVATEEVIGGRICIVPELRARSSTRRLGVSVAASAGVGDLGYIDHWTAPIESLHPDGAPLVVGEPFAQIIFHATFPSRHAYRGQYRESDWPANMIPAKLRGQNSTLR